MRSGIFVGIQSSQLNLKARLLQSMCDDSGASETCLNAVCFVCGCLLAENTQLSALKGIAGINHNLRDGYLSLFFHCQINTWYEQDYIIKDMLLIWLPGNLT